MAEARLRGEGFNEIHNYTADNYILTVTDEGFRQAAGATAKSNYNFWRCQSDSRGILANSTENWQRINNSSFGTYDIIKVSRNDGNCHIVYRPQENTTAIVFEAGGRVGDNYTFYFEGKVPEAKCRGLIDFVKTKLSPRHDEKALLDFMNGKI